MKYPLIYETHIPYLDVLQRKKYINYLHSGELTLVNIICPGYQKRRDGVAEVFDFPFLSPVIQDCPNVQLMIKKMNTYLAALQQISLKVSAEMILADVAILNYEHLSTVQDVQCVMDEFFNSIHQSPLYDGTIVHLQKMSLLEYQFREIPLSGISVVESDMYFEYVQTDIRKKAEEYIGSLCFDRINRAMADGTYNSEQRRRIIDQATREVARFVKEYGLAGQAIQKLYQQPVIAFTEPSGYMRGYFYHAYIAPQDRPPVVYLS